MKTVIGKLKDGEGVCLFPEATRSTDGKISAFKPGFGLLCRRGRAAVVPVVVDGGFEAWPRSKKMFKPGVEINVRYGECISAEKIKGMGDRDLADKLTQKLRQMQNEVRRAAGKKEFDYSREQEDG
jgi:1-acyl-sn-glycerol-3-phosphate acyltransferase